MVRHKYLHNGLPVQPVEPRRVETMPVFDTSRFHEGLRGYRFRAVNVANIETGEVIGWRIMLKKRGRGHKWRFAGDSKNGPYLFDSECAARDAARECNAWSRGEKTSN